MKIRGVDNFNRESVNDILVAENIPNHEYGVCMVDALNEMFCSSEHATRYFELVEDDYKLYVFEP
jgi:hypothetical protein